MFCQDTLLLEIHLYCSAKNYLKIGSFRHTKILFKTRKRKHIA